MFNENFSFVSGSSDPMSASVNACTSTDISPFTSRCTSPAPAEIISYRTRKSSRYDSYQSSRPSIKALTAQLEAHSLTQQQPLDVAEWSDDSSPPSTSEDEGFFDGPETPRSISSEFSFDPSLYDLSMSDLGATSSPRPSLSLEAQENSSYTIRRRQRQVLVRLQCLAKRTPDLAMLIEECHPSSIPSDVCWGTTGRSESVGSIPSGRVEKAGRDRGMVKRNTRMRKHRSS